MSMTPTDLALTAIPVAAATAAGTVAALHRPGQRITSGLQHFAAGVVFAAAAIELLPRVLAQDPPVAIVGFAAGIAVMFAMRAYTERVDARQRAARRDTEQRRRHLPAGLVGATAVDFLIDGVVLGAGFTVSGQVGLLLTLALTIEYLFVGLSVAATLDPAASRGRTIALPTLLSLLTVAGAVLGAYALADATPFLLAGVLAFGAVAFMYLVTEELLVQAHRYGETAVGSTAYFVGFLLYLVLKQVLGQT